MNHKYLYIIAILSSHLIACTSSNVTAQGSKVAAEDILRTIQEGKDVWLENKTIEGTIDFTQLTTANIESNAVTRHHVTGSITVKNCDIKGKIICYRAEQDMHHLVAFAKNISFISCKFKDEVQIRESSVYGRVVFTGCTFDKITIFEGSTFVMDATFGDAQFNEETRFQNCNFQHRSNFMNAQFDKTVSFQGSNFALDAQFSNVHFHGYADMTVINWTSHCFFNYAEFKQQAIFNNSYFKGRAEFIATVFGGNTELKHCYFYGYTRFNNAKLNDKLTLDYSSFILAMPETTGFAKGDKLKISLVDTKVWGNQSLSEKDFGQ